MARRLGVSRARWSRTSGDGPGMLAGGSTTPTQGRFMPGSQSPTSSAPPRLNLKLLRRTIRFAKPYWLSDEKQKARWLLALLILLLVGYTECAVLFNQQSGEFTSALAARNAPRFWHSI